MISFMMYLTIIYISSRCRARVREDDAYDDGEEGLLCVGKGKEKAIEAAPNPGTRDYAFTQFFDRYTTRCVHGDGPMCCFHDNPPESCKTEVYDRAQVGNNLYYSERFLQNQRDSAWVLVEEQVRNRTEVHVMRVKSFVKVSKRNRSSRSTQKR